MKDLIKAHSISRFRSLKDLLFWLSGVRPSLPEPIIKLMCHSEHEFLLSEQFSCNLCLSLQGLIFPFSGRSKIERFLWYAEPATLKCQYDTAILKTEMPWDLGTVLGNPGNELGTKARCHIRCHSVLGIPFPKSLAFWESPSHITVVFWASPGTLSGCPNP